MKRILAVLLMLVLAATMCTAIAEEKTYVIGMSQCNLGEPWRVAMNDQIAAAAKDYPMFEVIYADAAQDNSKQIASSSAPMRQASRSSCWTARLTATPTPSSSALTTYTSAASAVSM